jgi:4-carboxymuconolactone decarboxylase
MRQDVQRHTSTAFANPQEPAMRLSEARLQPLPEAELSDDALRALGRKPGSDAPLLNIFATLAHHPKLMKRWLVFGNHVLAKSTLPAREREIVILRIGWLCQAEYEFGQHTVIGKQTGLSDEEIERITQGPDADGWCELDTLLLRAVDELHADAIVSDATWKSLSSQLSTEQLLDLVFAVGQYNLESMALNTLGVQLDEGVPGFPD